LNGCAGLPRLGHRRAPCIDNHRLAALAYRSCLELTEPLCCCIDQASAAQCSDRALDMQIGHDVGFSERLWRKKRILLLPLRKHNQKSQWQGGVQRRLGWLRHRVETVFSTLATVFNVERPRGRSLAGHLVRIATCVLAHTLSFFMQ
jgi:hypothetical protein